MAEEEVTGQDIFDDAVTEAPKAEVEATKEEATTEDRPSRERDERGRFVSKEAQPDGEAVEQAPVVEETKEERHDHIPSWRLREEAEAKREAMQRAEWAERQAIAYQAQMAELQRQVQSLQPKPEPVDIFADPEAYQRNVQQSMETRFRSLEGNFSLRLAAAKHSDFMEAFNEVLQLPMSDPIRQQVIASPDPGETLVQLYRRERVIQEVGPDPLAYRTRVLESALQDPQFLAAALEAAKASAGAAPTNNKIDLPPSLNKAAAARGGDDGDTSDRGMYLHATR